MLEGITQASRFRFAPGGPECPCDGRYHAELCAASRAAGIDAEFTELLHDLTRVLQPRLANPPCPAIVRTEKCRIPTLGLSGVVRPKQSIAAWSGLLMLTVFWLRAHYQAPLTGMGLTEAGWLLALSLLLAAATVWLIRHRAT